MKSKVVKKSWNEVESQNFRIDDENGQVKVFNHSTRISSVNLLSIDKKRVSELIRVLQKYQEVSK